jgi:hypothetical protein
MYKKQGTKNGKKSMEVGSFFHKNKVCFVYLSVSNTYFMKCGAGRYMWAKPGYNK